MAQTIEINHNICKYAEITEVNDKRIARLYLDKGLDREEHFIDEPVEVVKEGEYFYLPHLDYLEKHPNLDEFKLFCTFNTRPADALDYVINDVADAVITTRFLFTSPFETRLPIRPVIFLDREIGQKIHEEILNGWKIPKFKWSLSRIQINYFSSIREFLRKDYKEIKLNSKICHFFSLDADGMGKIPSRITRRGELPASEIYFADTEEEIKEMILKVKNEILEFYKKIPNTTDEEIMKELDQYRFEPFQYLLIEDCRDTTFIQ